MDSTASRKYQQITLGFLLVVPALNHMTRLENLYNNIIYMYIMHHEHDYELTHRYSHAVKTHTAPACHGHHNAIPH